MEVRQYVKSVCPFLTEELIDALLQFKRAVFPQLQGSSIVLHRARIQESDTTPFVVLMWEGGDGGRTSRCLQPFELLLLAYFNQHQIKEGIPPPLDAIWPHLKPNHSRRTVETNPST